MKFSFIILTYNRAQATREAIDNVLFFLDLPENCSRELILVNNNSSEDYTGLELYLKSLEQDSNQEIVYFKNDKNFGVAGGRNQAMEAAKGEIIISLDDDAEFRESNTLQIILDLFVKYEKENVKLLTFKVVEQADGSVDIATKNPANYQKNEFFTSYFKGGCHAILNDSLKEVGMYELDGLYGAEEYDLAYKFIDQGYKIVHSSSISILHKRVLSGRMQSKEVYARLMKNKTILAYKYLPYRYYLSHLFLWSLFFLFKSRFKLAYWWKSCQEILLAVKSLPRKPISKQARSYIIKNGGRLSY
ncbi:MAG: glycosyltransferase [Chitinophagales bacterium]